MTLKPFTYVPAESLQAAQDLLGEHAGQAAALAGGTDLLGVLKDAVHVDAPALLIGLKPLADLRYVQETPEGVRIGALTTLAEIARHPAIRARPAGPGRGRSQRRLAANSQRGHHRR